VLIVTRPAPAAARFVADVTAALGAPLRNVIHPVLRFAPVAAALPDGPLAALIFGSEQAVGAARELGPAPGLRAYCVGDRTAQVARSAGFDAISAQGDADDLVALIIATAPQGPLCHIRGRHSRGAICARLNAAGLTCTEVVAYDQTAVPPDSGLRALLAAADPVILPLFSPRSAEILAPALNGGAPLHIVAMSDAVAAALGDLPVASLRIVRRPDHASMVAATGEAALALGIRGALQEGRSDDDQR
jgi:uroporphyrinogen-III synthase